MQKINKVIALLMNMVPGVVLTSCAVVADRETVGEYVDDAGITTKVKAAILEDKTVAPFQIHVETMQNIVQLSGFVDSQHTALQAEKLAKEVKGVRGVKNNLIVRTKKGR